MQIQKRQLEHIYLKSFKVKVGVHQGSVLSPLLFTVVIDVVRNRVKVGTSQEILYADDLVLIAKTLAEPQKKFNIWKSALESKGLKVNLVKTKVMVSKIGQVTVKPSSKTDPCGICGRKTISKAVLCKQCGNTIHGRYAKINRVTDLQ